MKIFGRFHYKKASKIKNKILRLIQSITQKIKNTKNGKGIRKAYLK